MTTPKMDCPFKIEIHHPCGHITEAEIDLSEMRNYHTFNRIGYTIDRVHEVLEHVLPQVPKGTKFYLIAKSKANDCM